MASIFTYDPDPPRVSSPWSTSGSSTPQLKPSSNRGVVIRTRSSTALDNSNLDFLSDYGITKLEPEPQEGPTEYKLHLLLRPRRLYTAISTGHLVAGSYHSRASLSSSGPAQASYEANVKPMLAKSSQSRHQRLQQLTTQLLWRLQQSSPFHSATTSNLVLPVLPEATIKLGVPQKPSRLLPGLEESQGALYEIGVADDGTFVGLTQDELEESLTNLQSMAASLGCKVEVLRRVVVGNCEWTDDCPDELNGSAKVHAENLWVAEALVSPDLEYYRLASKGGPVTATACGEASVDASEMAVFEEDYSHTEQIRISITGPSTAGKSSLLGTLTTSSLDNGRGKSRLSLLKHRHEIPSGITSSVAQELIGYAAELVLGGGIDVINYASGNVTAWDDIHAASDGGRLAFVSDLPGMTRYVKSTLRGIVSWAPHYLILCIPATSGEDVVLENGKGVADEISEMDLSLSYLDLCIKLEVPILVVITKMDLATRAGLRNTLAKLLSALKVADKKPAMLPVSPGAGDKAADLHEIARSDLEDVRKIINTANGNWDSTVPIILSSAVDGTGIGKLHAFIRQLPIPERPPLRTISLAKGISSQASFANIFDIDEVFEIPPSKVYSLSAEQAVEDNRGVVLCGLVRYGAISIGDELVIGPLVLDQQSERVSHLPVQRSRSEHYSNTPPQATSLRSRPPSREFPTTLISQAHWQRVRVVSVRNLRLSVRKLMADQVGTIGIEPIPSSENEEAPRLGKIRKGMVLANFHEQLHATPKSLPFHTGFVATFASSEFSSSVSPPLILGGHAIAYIANIRSTVKVTCVTLAENEIISSPPSPTEPEFFSFDGDSVDRDKTNGGSQRGADTEINKVISASSNGSGPETTIRIAFSFITSSEWVEVGSRVFLMPGASTVSSAAGEVVSLSGLEGFVGRVADVFHGEG